jgi:hypothetical protein
VIIYVSEISKWGDTNVTMTISTETRGCLLDILVLVHSVRPGRNTAMRDRCKTDRLKRLLRTWDGDTMGTERVRPAGTDYTHNITTRSVKKAVDR